MQLWADCVCLAIWGLRGGLSAPSWNTDELTTDDQRPRVKCVPGHLVEQVSILWEGPD